MASAGPRRENPDRYAHHTLCRTGIITPPSNPSLAAIVVCSILLASCSEKPEYAHLPRQYQPSAQNDFIPDLPLLVMGTAPFVPEDGTINGILGTGAPWLWSNEHPSFRLFLRDRGPWQFVLEYAGTNATLKDTGPVTVSVSINDIPFSKFAVNADGRGEYVRDVPSSLALMGAVRVGLTIQPFWTSPRDGQRLGVLIHSLGFRKRAG